MPYVTIGLPVYNGALLIRECLENLANQSYRDFEVLISDNGSTDGTSDICAEFAAADHRFRHVRHESTSSANDNFLWVRDAANSPLFMFRAYDDLATPDYLASLVAVLDAAPNARLAVSTIRQEFGAAKAARLFPYPLSPGADASPDAYKLLNQMFRGHASWFYGLWRREGCVDSYDRVQTEYTDPWGSDHLILLHAILQGGANGSQGGSAFVQRVLPTPRFYKGPRRASFEEMTARNRAFLATARNLLEESPLAGSTRRLVSASLPLYSLWRCHGAKRLLQARIKKMLHKSETP